MSDSSKNFRTKVVIIKSILSSNNFPINLIEKEVNKFVSSKVTNVNNEVKDKINIYLCNRMTEHYNKDNLNILYTTMCIQLMKIQSLSKFLLPKF